MPPDTRRSRAHRRRRAGSIAAPADEPERLRAGRRGRLYPIGEGQGRRRIGAGQGSGHSAAREARIFGEECLTGQPLRLATVSAMTDCVIMRIEKAAMVHALRDEPSLSEMFMAYIWLAMLESMRTWSISSSNQARSALRGFSCSWRMWPKTRSGVDTRENQPGDPRGDGRHNAVPCERLHEQVPRAWVHRVQRRPMGCLC